MSDSIYADEQVIDAVVKAVNEVPEAFVSRAHIADQTLRTVAPFVAERERQAAAKALREAAAHIEASSEPDHTWAGYVPDADNPGGVPIPDWLRERADAIEAQS